jgi:hypothetical protein
VVAHLVICMGSHVVGDQFSGEGHPRHGWCRLQRCPKSCFPPKRRCRGFVPSTLAPGESLGPVSRTSGGNAWAPFPSLRRHSRVSVVVVLFRGHLRSCPCCEMLIKGGCAWSFLIFSTGPVFDCHLCSVELFVI